MGMKDIILYQIGALIGLVGGALHLYFNLKVWQTFLLLLAAAIIASFGTAYFWPKV